jgi:hypothetical protein
LALGGATLGTNALAVTGTTQLNSALTYGGVTLTNNVTGTGKMVLSASPTFTGTITAAAANLSGAFSSGNFTISTGGTNTIVSSNNSSTGGTYNILSLNGAYSEGTNLGIEGGGGTDPNLYVQSGYASSTSGNIVFRIGGSALYTEAARFSSAGNLLLGATAAIDANLERLLVAYSAPKTGASFICNADTNNYAITFRNSNGLVGSINTATTATAYNTSSDARLKTNISDAATASALIDAIQVRQFDWKSDNSHQRYGMIAQELLEVAPEAVIVPTDPEDMMGVDYSKLVPMLIKAIQELTTRLAALEAK